MDNIARLDDYRKQIGGIASKILDEELMKKIGQLSAFAGVGYGGYKLANSTVGMSVGSAASSSIGEFSDEVGFTFNEWSASHDFEGRAYRPTQRSYDISNQVMNEASAGIFGTGIGAGSTAAMLGSGYLLSQTGIASGVGALASGAGSAAGTAIGQGIFGLAGGGINAGLSAMGMGGMGGMAATGMGYAGSGAGMALGTLGGAVGAMAMPLAGAWAAGKVADTFSNQIAYQRQAEGEIQELSHRFTPGMATNAVTGRGLNYRDSAELAAETRESLSENLYMRQGDLDEILEGMTEGELLYNVRGAEEFQDKFEKVTDSLRDISRIYETTLKESAEMLGEMQRSGFYTTADQTEMLLQSDAIGRMTGYTGAEVVQMGQQGARTAREMGLSRSLGYEAATMSNLVIEENVQSLSEEESQDYLENIEEVGGKEQATAQTSQFLMSLTQDRKFQGALFGVLNEEGEINQEELDKFLSGETGFNELRQQGVELIAGSREMNAEFQTNAANYFEKLEGPELIQFLGKTVESFNEQMGLEDQNWDIENTLKLLGLEDQKMRKVIEGAIKSSGLIDENALMRKSIEQQIREDRLEKRSLSGVMERISNFLAESGREFTEWTGVEDTYIDFRSTLEEGFNRYARGIETVGEWSYDEVDYDTNFTNENIVSSVRGILDEGEQESLATEIARMGGINTFKDREHVIEKGAEIKLKEMTGDWWGNYELPEGSVGEVFTDEFVGVSNKLLGYGLDEQTLEEGTITYKDEDSGKEQDFTIKELISDEELGFSEDQQEIFQDIFNESQDEYRRRIKVFERQNGAPPTEEQRTRIKGEVIEEYQSDMDELGGMGELTNTIRANEMFKNKLTGIEGYLRAEDNLEAADVIKDIRESDATLSEGISSLYDGVDTNGVSDEELISSLGDENQQEVLTLGLEYTSGALSRDELMVEMRNNPLFRDQDLEGMTSLPTEEFNQTIDNVLSEEFMSLIADDSETQFTKTTVEEQEDYWREMLKDEIKATGGAIATNLDENTKMLEEVDKTLKINMDKGNNNDGTYNGNYGLLNGP